MNKRNKTLIALLGIFGSLASIYSLLGLQQNNTMQQGNTVVVGSGNTVGNNNNNKIFIGTHKENKDELNRVIIKAKNGDSDAQAKIGLHYYKENKIHEAEYWWRNAAKQDHPYAQYWLGQLYSTGQVGKINLKENAFKFFLLAAEKGILQAQTNVGTMYLTGEGTTLDMISGINWLKRAAENGDAKAQMDLGIIYSQGIKEIGLNSDTRIAKKWLHMAKKQGYKNGRIDSLLEKLK